MILHIPPATITIVIFTIALLFGDSVHQISAAGIVWQDEFDGPAGSAPNPQKWRHEVGGGGWGNGELEVYKDSVQNAALDGNGNLVITARRESDGTYTSARLLTAGHFSHTYGRFEARMRLPQGKGIWPAFWLLGDNGKSWPENGEIDIMELLGHDPGTIYGTIHGPNYSGGNGISSKYTLPNGGSFANAFHTVAVDWTQDVIAWSVDGVEYARKGKSDVAAKGGRWVFDHQFFIILNFAVGGYWPGNPDSSTKFPQEMIVDYIRVYDSGPPSQGNKVVGLAGKCLDVAGGGTADGTPVQLFDCNGSAAQRWVLTSANDVVNPQADKCLDVEGGSTENGARVRLWTCNGSGAQKWHLSPGHDLVNTAADKCMDVVDGKQDNRTPLQLWQCNGQPQQKWFVQN